MRPIDFLNVANRFHASPDEAERRTSISRSYYATFHVLFDSLLQQGVDFRKTGEDHERLIYYLVNSGDHRTQMMGGNLRTLKSARGDADYRLKKPIQTFHSQLAFQTADQTISRFGRIPPGDLQGIVTTIRGLMPYKPPVP